MPTPVDKGPDYAPARSARRARRGVAIGFVAPQDRQLGVRVALQPWSALQQDDRDHERNGEGGAERGMCP